MSISVNQIVLHQLINHTQQDGSNKLDSILREQLLPISADVEQLMLQLHQT